MTEKTTRESKRIISTLYLVVHPIDLVIDNKMQVILGPSRLQVTIIFDTPLNLSLLDIIYQHLNLDDFSQDRLSPINYPRCSKSILEPNLTSYLINLHQ